MSISGSGGLAVLTLDGGDAKRARLPDLGSVVTLGPTILTMPETVTSTAAADTYRLDPRASRVTVQAFAEGLFSAFGHNPRMNAGDFSGEVQLAPDAFETASLQFTVRADSLKV